MVAIDTNILTRYILQDDRKQANEAKQIIDGALERGETLFITDIVLCELVWFIKRFFGYDKGTIINMLEGIYSSSQTRFASRERVRTAIDAYSKGKGDFADYMIREQAFEAGSKCVVTFDEALIDETGFERIST